MYDNNNYLSYYYNNNIITDKRIMLYIRKKYKSDLKIPIIIAIKLITIKKKKNCTDLILFYKLLVTHCI